MRSSVSKLHHVRGQSLSADTAQTSGMAGRSEDAIYVVSGTPELAYGEEGARSGCGRSRATTSSCRLTSRTSSRTRTRTKKGVVVVARTTPEGIVEKLPGLD